MDDDFISEIPPDIINNIPYFCVYNIQFKIYRNHILIDDEVPKEEMEANHLLYSIARVNGLRLNANLFLIFLNQFCIKKRSIKYKKYFKSLKSSRYDLAKKFYIDLFKKEYVVYLREVHEIVDVLDD